MRRSARLQRGSCRRCSIMYPPNAPLVILCAGYPKTLAAALTAKMATRCALPSLWEGKVAVVLADSPSQSYCTFAGVSASLPSRLPPSLPPPWPQPPPPPSFPPAVCLGQGCWGVTSPALSLTDISTTLSSRAPLPHQEPSASPIMMALVRHCITLSKQPLQLWMPAQQCVH